MATYFNILAWETPQIEGPDRLAIVQRVAKELVMT